MGQGEPPPRTGAGADVLAADGLVAMPGFIDLHVHGAIGVDVMDADPDGLARMARFFAGHGVTAWLPSTMTATAPDTERALEAVRAVAGPVDGGATILGAYLEGPYLQPRARAGAEDPADIRPADRAEASRLLDPGIARVLVLAPEVEQNRWLIAVALVLGVAACGESGGDDDQSSAQSGPRTMTIWLMEGSAPPAVVDAVNAEWKKAHPNDTVKVELQQWNNITTKLDAAFAGSSPPDVVELGNTLVSKYAAAGALQDLSGSRGEFENNQAWLPVADRVLHHGGQARLRAVPGRQPGRHLPQEHVRQGRHHRAPGQPRGAARPTPRS